MTDAELLMYQLRNPPVMSMALSKDYLYKMMAERMNAAADHIEKLQRENARLRKVKVENSGPDAGSGIWMRKE